MNVQRKLTLVIAITALALSTGLLLDHVTAQPSATVSGVVVDNHGPVAGATVRMQTAATSTTAGPDGTFTLEGLPAGETIIVTAWTEGYYPGGEEVVPPQDDVTITLRLHPAEDNPDHAWLTSYADPDDPLGCCHCMVACQGWKTNAHGLSGTNARFQSMYNGTNIDGSYPVAPGYVVDFPGTAGNCANCHAPGAAANQPFTARMDALTGVEAEGVFCDFCHKVADVYLNPATGLPYTNAPGVQSMRLNRPPADTHMFYGTFDDVTRRVSYLGLEKQSEFCAPCHQFSYWGTPIYESFNEWLESSYPARGIECQTCHMAPTGVDYFVYPENGGLIRPPEMIASHAQPGAASEVLLQNTVTMQVTAEQTGGQIAISVAITNTEAGHHVPTDYPGRHLILVVEAVDADDTALRLLEGPTVPDWGGAEAGQPGMAYAKVLRDAITGDAPVVSYWRQTFIDSDNRIPAQETALSRYAFASPAEDNQVTIHARLIFRRLYQPIADAKGWDSPDILMEEVYLQITE